MNNSMVRFGIAAAAVALAAVIGISLLSGPNLGGDPDPTPSAPPSATPSPAGFPDLPTASGPVEAGTYVVHPFAAELNPEADEDARSIRFTLTVPDGWQSFGGVALLPMGEGSSKGPDGMGLGFGQVHGLYSNPCHGLDVAPDIAVGPTVDDLASALGEQTAYEATTPTDVMLGGYSGKRMDLLLPSGGPYEECIAIQNFIPWDGSIYAQGLGNQWHLWILDVDGVRVLVMTQDFAGTRATDQAELQAIVDSIQIDTGR